MTAATARKVESLARMIAISRTSAGAHYGGVTRADLISGSRLLCVRLCRGYATTARPAALSGLSSPSLSSPSHVSTRLHSYSYPSSSYSSSSSSSSSNAIGSPSFASRQLDEEGRIVLYRGPCTLRKGWFLFLGGTFICIGLQISYNIYHHFSWPILWIDRDRKPELVAQWKRTLGAVSCAAVGVGSVRFPHLKSLLIFAIPSRTVTRLSLDLRTRQLVIRTAMRGFSSLPPRILYPRPLRRLAERHGWYLTKHNNERVVPLASVYRLRGSASEHPSASSPVLLRSRHNHKAKGKGTSTRTIAVQKTGHDPERRTIELRVRNERLWYNVEAAGGAPLGSSRNAGIVARIAYWFRGSTDWSDVERPPLLLGSDRDGSRAVSNSETPSLVGEKQPWFSDRRTFDDVFPLVRRR